MDRGLDVVVLLNTSVTKVKDVALSGGNVHVEFCHLPLSIVVQIMARFLNPRLHVSRQ